MSLSIKTCYNCGRILQGTLNSDKNKPSRLGECWKCQEKREREEGKDIETKTVYCCKDYTIRKDMMYFTCTCGRHYRVDENGNKI